MTDRLTGHPEARGDPSPNSLGEIARRRTIAIISHPDAGKTTLTEHFPRARRAIQLATSEPRASATAPERKRAAAGRIANWIVRPSRDDDPLLQAMELPSADAENKGFTTDRLAAEFAAHKRER